MLYHNLNSSMHAETFKQTSIKDTKLEVGKEKLKLGSKWHQKEPIYDNNNNDIIETRGDEKFN